MKGLLSVGLLAVAATTMSSSAFAADAPAPPPASAAPTAPPAPTSAPVPPPAAAPAAAPAPAPTNPTWLAAPAPAPAIGQPDAPRSSWRTALSVLFIGGLAGGAYWLRRKKNAPQGGKSSTSLRVMDTVRIGPRAQLLLAAVNGRMLLLGVTDKSVHRIGWVGRVPPQESKPVAIADAEDGEESTSSDNSLPARPFVAMLQNLLGDRTESSKLSAAETIAAKTHDVVERSDPRAPYASRLERVLRESVDDDTPPEPSPAPSSPVAPVAPKRTRTRAPRTAAVAAATTAAPSELVDTQPAQPAEEGVEGQITGLVMKRKRRA